jgi:hypothetical protein
MKYLILPALLITAGTCFAINLHNPLSQNKTQSLTLRLVNMSKNDIWVKSSSSGIQKIPHAITASETGVKIMKNGDIGNVKDTQITDTITHNTFKTGNGWLKFSSNLASWEKDEIIKINLIQYRHNAANKKCSGNTHFVTYQPTWWGKRKGYSVLAVFNCKDPASKKLLIQFQNYESTCISGNLLCNVT